MYMWILIPKDTLEDGDDFVARDEFPENPWYSTARVRHVRPLCVKMALICKNGVKVRVRVRVRVRDRIGVRVRVRVRVRIMVSVSSMYR